MRPKIGLRISGRHSPSAVSEITIPKTSESGTSGYKTGVQGLASASSSGFLRRKPGSPGVGRETTLQVWTCDGPNGPPCRDRQPRPKFHSLWGGFVPWKTHSPNCPSLLGGTKPTPGTALAVEVTLPGVGVRDHATDPGGGGGVLYPVSEAFPTVQALQRRRTSLWKLCRAWATIVRPEPAKGRPADCGPVRRGLDRPTRTCEAWRGWGVHRRRHCLHRLWPAGAGGGRELSSGWPPG